MMNVLYQEWLQEWDRELTAKRRNILLLQDNFTGHIVPTGLQDIRVENFALNLTVHVQPKDQGIIRCFKAHYRWRYMQCAINHYDASVTPLEIYDINQLEVMHLAEAAWKVDMTTIRHCWCKAGILPAVDLSQVDSVRVPSYSLINSDVSPAQDPITHVERQVEEALDSLVSTGALQTSNCMRIENLLNPAAKHTLIDNTTDKDIYKAIVKS
jgi:hypothetical protein